MEKKLDEDLNSFTTEEETQSQYSLPDMKCSTKRFARSGARSSYNPRHCTVNFNKNQFIPRSQYLKQNKCQVG
jgi:hypothetical protein